MVSPRREHAALQQAPRASRLAHPMFVGHCAVAIGTPLCMGSWLGVGVGVILAIGLYLRSLQEDAMHVNFARLPAPIPSSTRSPTAALRHTFTTSAEVITRVA